MSRQELQHIFEEITGKKIDSKHLQLWEKQISQTKEKTLQDFIENCYKSPDYQNKISQLFRNTYYDVIGFDLSFETVKTFIEHSMIQKLTTNDIRSYITHLPQFHEKYNTIIKKVYKRLFDVHDDPPAQIHAFYMQRVRDIEGYDIDHMSRDMNALIHQHLLLESSFSQEIPDTTNNDFLKSSPPQKLEEQQTIHLLTWDENALECFENIFQRPMFVQEYFKYVIQEKKNTREQFQTQHDIFLSRLIKLQNILADYLDETLDVYEFVKRFLYASDQPSFFDDFIAKIVHSSQYQEFMFRHIHQLYLDIFNETLDDHDLRYIFEKVQPLKMAFKSEALRDSLLELKNETDDIIGFVFKIYMDVLERSPDDFEISALITFFREAVKIGESYDVINAKIEKKLMNSLEFHDILKKKIKETYPTIIPRLLFEFLSELLQCIDKETLPSIQEKIKKWGPGEQTYKK